MIYFFKMKSLPELGEVYTVTRKTVWETADEKNIMVLVTKGSCFFEIDTKKYFVKCGEAFFVPSNQTYRRSPCDDELCTMVYIHFKTGEEIFEWHESDAEKLLETEKKQAEERLIMGNSIFLKEYPIYLKNHITGVNKLENLAEKIMVDIKKPRLENLLSTVVCFCEILNELSKTTQKQMGTRISETEAVRVPHSLKKAILYIKQNSFERINVAELAKKCNVSQSQLARYFKEEFGKTPIQYINEYKLNRAKDIIRTMPYMPIGAVAENFGFDDQHYFSRLFVKTFGETPSQYRFRVVNFKEISGNNKEH